MKAARRDIG